MYASLVNPAPSALRAARSVTLAVWTTATCFALAWLLPYHTYPFWSFYNDYVATLGVVVALLVLCSAAEPARLRVPLAAWLPLGITVWIVGQTLAGQLNYRADALLPIAYLLAAVAAAVVGHNTARVRPGLANDVVSALAVAVLVAAVLSAFITFYQYLGIDLLLGDWSVAIGSDGKTAVRPYANLGQPNQLALILCWGIAACWLVFQRGWLHGPVAVLLAVLIVISLALTQSKVGWIIAPLIAAMAAWSNRWNSTRRVASSTIVALLLLYIAVILLLPVFEHWTGTPTESVTQRMETNGVRSVMIEEGFFIGWQHPLFGVGWMGYPTYQILVAPLFGETQFAMHSHNLLANLSAEFGWIATAMIVVATGAWLYRHFVRRRLDPAIWFVGMFLLAVAVHSMVEFPLWYAYVLLPVFYLAGAVEAGADGSDASVARRGIVALHRNWFVAFGLCGAVLSAVIATSYRDVVQSFRALGYERIGAVYDRGSTARPSFTVFPQFYDYIAFAGVHPTVGVPASAIADYERVGRRFGYAAVLMRISILYALNGRTDDAVELMTSFRKLYRLRYAEAYAAWAQMAREYPDVLGKVYVRLPPPA